jgi:FkbM family methyltransferase
MVNLSPDHTYQVSASCQIKNLGKIYHEIFGYPSKGLFVEVGAYDGESYSNTSCLADHGWQGIYIEPIAEYALKCKDRHAKNKVAIVNAAIGRERKAIDIFKGEALSTLDSEMVSRYGEITWSKHVDFKQTTCQQIRLEDLLKYFRISPGFDLLVVDVEGKETEVFSSFDLSYWLPKVLIVEIEDDHTSFQPYQDFVEDKKNLRRFIHSNGYIEIYRDPINTLFLRQDIFKALYIGEIEIFHPENIIPS